MRGKLLILECGVSLSHKAMIAASEANQFWKVRYIVIYCRSLFAGCLLISMASVAWSHDTWVQTNTNLIRTRDAVHIDLMLGNHGNEHRDFKLASKIALAGCDLKVHSPSGKVYDVKDRLSDLGYTPKEGFWSTKFGTADSGIYIVEHSIDKVVNHGRPVRSIKGAKAFFLATPSLDKVPADTTGFGKPLGHALELVPVVNPVAPMGPGKPIQVKVLLKGKPLANGRVSFVPRGHTLANDFDEQYERRTDDQGLASFTPTEGNYYLVVVHHQAPEEKSKDYELTQYSATLTVFVPDVCPCCGD